MQNSKKTICFPCVLSTIYCLLLLFLGCGNNRHAVIAVTGTNIGVEISQNPANQTPQAKLGYQRVEIAIVPTNRTGEVSPTSSNSMLSGAKDVADVLMELRFSNIFSFTNAGIYQRLAVGETAVSQSGAAFMFAKDDHGKITDETAKAIKNIEAIKTRDPKIRAEMRKIADYYRDNPDKGTIIEDAVKKSGYKDWDSFLDNKPSEPSPEAMETIKKELCKAGIIL